MADEAFQPELDDIGMGMAAPTKVVSGPDLVRIDNRASELGLNRRLSLQVDVGLVDPEGVNVLRPVMVHRHAQMEDAEPHMRCRGYVKLNNRGANDPYETYIDVPMDMFNELPTVREYEAMVGMEAPEVDEDWELFCAQLLAWIGEQGNPKSLSRL